MKYKTLNYIDFIETTLEIKLTDKQKVMLELFEKNKKNPQIADEDIKEFATLLMKMTPEKREDIFKMVLKEELQSTPPLKVTCPVYCSKDTVSVDEVIKELGKRTKLLGI